MSALSDVMLRRKSLFIISLLVLLSFTVCVEFGLICVEASNGVDVTKTYVKLLWSDPTAVSDVAVSKNGNYLAMVNSSGIYYFAVNNSHPKWWYSQLSTYFSSVAISADAEYVVAGTSNGYIHYFNDSKARNGEQSFPTWNSTTMWANIGSNRLSMSDDGEYVVVGGMGTIFHYFAGCRGRTGIDEDPTWSSQGIDSGYASQAMSPDGKYVIAGGNNLSSNFVRFYKDANATPYPTQPSWSSSSSIDYGTQGMAVSDDGSSAVAVDGSKLHYWVNATTLTGDPNATWTNDGSFNSVDMSADGNNVTAGGTGLHFWTNARDRQGNQTINGQDWVKLESETVYAVAISEDGGIIAAPAWNGSSYKAYFFKSDGSKIGEFNLQDGRLVSMSGDGQIIAIGGYSFFSLYVFEVLEDLTPPVIENVYQQPANDSVTPDDEVVVYANVTDDESGLRNVFLNYTNGNGTWITVNMTNLEGDTWNATIPVYPYLTNVTYVITAEDNVGNTITTQELLGYEYQYQVIPEFPSAVIFPLLIIVALVVFVLGKPQNRIKRSCDVAE